MERFRFGVEVNARREFIVSVPSTPEEKAKHGITSEWLEATGVEDEKEEDVIASAILWDYRMKQMGYEKGILTEGLVKEDKEEQKDLEWVDIAFLWKIMPAKEEE